MVRPPRIPGAPRWRPATGEDVLEHFRDAVKQGEAPHPDAMKFIAEAFGEALEALAAARDAGERRRTERAGSALARALVLHGKRGRRPELMAREWAQDRGVRRAARMVDLLDAGATPDSACEAVAEEMHRSTRTVQRDYAKHGDDVRDIRRIRQTFLREAGRIEGIRQTFLREAERRAARKRR